MSVSVIYFCTQNEYLKFLNGTVGVDRVGSGESTSCGEPSYATTTFLFFEKMSVATMKSSVRFSVYVALFLPFSLRARRTFRHAIFKWHKLARRRDTENTDTMRCSACLVPDCLLDVLFEKFVSTNSS